MDEGFFYQPKPQWNPNQLEFQFFWPLTEQIPLQLDFSECSPHQYYVRAKGIAGVHGPFNTGMTYVSTASTSLETTNIEIKSGTVTFSEFEMPWYRKVLFKLMGFKWKK
jgi:hypothetical protein